MSYVWLWEILCNFSIILWWKPYKADAISALSVLKGVVGGWVMLKCSFSFLTLQERKNYGNFIKIVVLLPTNLYIEFGVLGTPIMRMSNLTKEKI